MNLLLNWVVIRFTIINAMGLISNSEDIYRFISIIRRYVSRDLNTRRMDVRPKVIRYLLNISSRGTIDKLRRIIKEGSNDKLKESIMDLLDGCNNTEDMLITNALNTNERGFHVLGYVMSDDKRFEETFDCTDYIRDMDAFQLKELIDSDGGKLGIMKYPRTDLLALNYRSSCLKQFFDRINYTEQGFLCYIDVLSLRNWLSVSNQDLYKDCFINTL